MGLHFGQKPWVEYQSPLPYNLRHFEISPATGGGGLFGPDPENKVMVNGLIWNLVPIMVRMILVNMQNFKLLAFLLLEIWPHKNFVSRREQVIRIRYLLPRIEQNSKKSLFMPKKYLFWHRAIFPSAFPWFSSKTKKFICSIFRDVSVQKRLQHPPGESILLKFCQNVSNRLKLKVTNFGGAR